MNTDNLISNLQSNAAIYAVAAAAALVITVVFRKWVIPFLYHTVEYAIYFAAAHSFLAGFVRAFSWFREETEFKNFKGDVVGDWTPYTTPFSLDFWQMSLYNPQWLFWLELAIAALLLYVVVIIRPTRLKAKPMQNKKPKPGEISGGSSYSDKLRAAGRGMKSARPR